MLPSLTGRRERFVCLLFVIIQFTLISFYSHAQKPEHMHEGVFRIRVSEGMARQLEKSSLKKNAANVGATGIESLDVVNKRFNVTAMKRVFPDAGKYEAKHRKYGLHRWYEVQLDKNTSINQAIPGFKSLKECEVAEPIYKKAFVGSSNMDFGPVTVKPNGAGTLPGTSNDPMLGNQWHYNNTGQTGGTAGADIKLLNAWAIETGSPNIVIAIEDGGIDLTHEDLSANLWVNSDEVPGNGIDDDNNGYVDDYNGYSFVDHTGNIQAHDHGTHVAGTVAAVNNNGIGVAGVAGGSGNGDGVRLMSCAVFSYWGGADGFAQAYIYSADNGAVISQNSWTYTAPGSYEQAVLDGIDYFTAEAGKDEFGNQVGPMNGGLVIFAAANFSSNANYYPAYYEPVLSVASTNHQDVKSWYSNFGNWVDISAPGGETNIMEQGVLSTLPSNQYGYYQGTSMACPHVSGVAGLVVSKLGGFGFNSQALRERLIQTADNIDGSNPDYLGMLGSGRLNAYAALGQNDDTPPAQITDLTFLGKDVTTITIGWTAPTDEGNGSASFYHLGYSTQPIDSENFELLPQISIPAKAAGSSETYTVTGLNGATTYYFAIKSFDYFANGSSISNVLSETTAFPPGISVTPQELSSDLLTGSATTVSFTIANSGLGTLTFSIPERNTSGHVTPLTYSGTIEPSQSMNIDVYVSASGLLNGSYQYDVEINSNDPVTPLVTIPVTINVTNNGVPIAYFSHNELGFGQLAIGKSKTLGFLVANEGSEPLHISGVFSGSPGFTSDISSELVIAPFQLAAVNVNCTPSALGTLEGFLTLHTNDPLKSEFVVSLYAEGVEGPKIVPNISELSFVVYKNHRETKSFQVANEGGSNLFFRVKEEAVLDSSLNIQAVVENKVSYTKADSSGAKQKSSNIFPAPSRPVIENTSLSTRKIRALIITPDPNPWDLYSWLSQYPDLELGLINGDLSWLNIQQLLYYDVVITTNNFQWSNANLNPETVGNLLADYVDAGGKVIVNQLAYSPSSGYKLEGRFISENYGPFTQASSSISNFVNLGTIAQPGHPVLQGVNNLQYNGNISQVNLTDESTRLADWDNGDVFLAINENVLGVNLLPSSGYGGNADWSGDLPQLYYNALVYMSDIKPSYLKIDPPFGEVFSNSMVQFTVKLDASGLESGEYQTIMKIYNNDAQNSVVSIPISLTVLSEQFSHTPDMITSTLARGETSTHSVVVTNLGTEAHHYEVDVEPNGIQSAIALTKTQGFDVIRNQPGPLNLTPLTQALKKRADNQPIPSKDFSISLSSNVPSVSNTVYATDFENFELGDLYQNGWFNYNWWRISDSNPFAGQKHIHHDSEVKNTVSYAIAPFVANGESLFSTVSMKLRVQGTHGELGILPSSFNGENNTTSIYFNESGIFAIVRIDDSDYVRYESISFARPEGYFEFTCELNEITGDFILYFDGKVVFKGRGFPGSIASVILVQWLPEHGDMTIDIDDFQIIDGKKYDNTPSYISVSPKEGSIAPGESLELTVTLNADSISSGMYAADVKFLADQDAIVVPALLEVLASPLVVNPDSIYVELLPGEKSSSYFDIENHSQVDIPFSITAIENSLDSALLAESKIGIQNASYGFIDPAQLTNFANKLTALRQRGNVSMNDMIQLGKEFTLPTSSASEYATDFEDFELGLASQFGWTSYLINVDTMDAFSGNKHLRGYSSTVNSTYIISPVVAPANSEVASISFKVKFSELTNSTQFIDFYGIAGFFGQLRYIETGKILMTSAHGQTEIEFEFETPSRYFEIGMEYSTVSGAYSLYLDGKKVGEGLGYSKDIAFAMIIHSSDSNGMVMDIDDFQIKEGRLHEAPDYLTITPTEGIIPAGGSARVNANFDAKWLTEGNYRSNILVSDGFDQVVVPVSLDVPEPQFAVNPDFIYAQVEHENTSSQTVTIENIGRGIFPYEVRVQNNGIASAILKMNEEGGRPQGTKPNFNQYEELVDIIESLKKGNNNFSIASNSTPGVLPASFQTTYATTFEEFQYGFLNQNGWASLGPWNVVSNTPYSGEKHIHLNLVPGGEKLGITCSPYITPGSGPFTRLSMRVKLEGPPVTRFLVAYSAATQGPVLGLLFDSNNKVSVFAPSAPEIFYTFPTGYFELTYEIEKATSNSTILVNGEKIYEGPAFENHLDFLSVYVSNEVNANSTTDIDDVQIVDANSSALDYLQVSPTFGALSAGESSEVNLTFNTSGLQSGDYFADLIFKIGGSERIIVPTHLNVYGYPEIEVNPSAFDVTVDYKQQSNENLVISNPGGEYLYFNLYVEDSNGPAQGTQQNPVSKFSSTDTRIISKQDEDKRLSKSIHEIKPGSISIMNGVYLLDEYFESGVPPSGWGVVSSAGAGPQWNTASSFGEGNYCYGGEAATVSSDAFGSAPLGTSLVSPVMSKSGYNNIVLQYYANYQNYGNRDFFDLDISVNGGEWMNILRWNEDHGSFRGYGEYVGLWLDGYLINASTFQLRWHYYDTNPGAWDWYAQIDNVSVTGQSIPWLTLNQSWGYIAPGTELNINAFFDGSQLEKGQLYKNIKVHSNSVNNPTLDIPVAFKINGPAIMAIEPDTVKARLYRGASSQMPLTITNAGDGMLNYSFIGFNSTASVQNNVSRIYPENYVVDKNVKDTRVGHPVLSGQGGPDAGGYSWKDSNENGGPLFNWQEIRNTGTYVSLGDDNSVTVPMPFTFKFYDDIYNEVTIGSNGYLTFGSVGWSLGNTEFPNQVAPNNIIAAHWDDLYPPAGGSVHYQSFGDRFIVQYTNVPYFYHSGLPNTFQIILYLNGDIALQYLEMNNTGSASTGIENSDGTVGLQVAFNTNYIHDNHAIVFSNHTVPTWVKPEPASGNIAGGASNIIDLMFNTETLEPGDYAAELGISSSDYFNPIKTLPVVLSVFDNYAPVVDSVLNTQVIETQSLNLVLTAHDADDPTVSVTLLNPPAFFNLTNSGNGSATYLVSPSFGQAGPYHLAIQAIDTRGLVTIKEITLNVVAYGVENFSLIDKRTGAVITNFIGSITLNKADANYPYYQIRANTNPPVVGSVMFVLDGKTKGTTTAPYILADNDLRNLKPGNHQLKATAYTQKSNKGQAGKSAEAVLTIINQQTQSTATVAAASVLIVPNPVEDEMKVEVTSELRGKSELVILDGTGLPVYRTTLTSADLKNYKVSMKEFSAGIYYLQITDEEGRRVTTRIVKK